MHKPRRRRLAQRVRRDIPRLQRRAIRGRSQAFSECRSRCCSTPSAIIIPDCMREAAAAITSRDRKQNVSVVETVVHLEKHLAREP